jgi:hypothetical protein
MEVEVFKRTKGMMRESKGKLLVKLVFLHDVSDEVTACKKRLPRISRQVLMPCTKQGKTRLPGAGASVSLPFERLRVLPEALTI